jgi:acetyltransferase-like isoleucine patch superfamily enzyme
VKTSVYNGLIKLAESIKYSITTFICKFKCRMNGVHLANGAKFYGNTTFRLYNKSNISIGANCRFRSSPLSNLIGINHRCIISTHNENTFIKIGDNCGFSGVVIGAFTQIILGNNVRCGANVLITDSDWHANDPRVDSPRPVKIGNNVWLGYSSIILKGVEIGDNSIIGAGSVVTKSIPANVIAAGNPCKVIKTL